MLPLPHLGRGLRRDEPAPREEPQHTGTRRALHGGDVRTEQPSFAKLHSFPLGTEDTIDDRTMKVEVGIQRRAEAMDKGHCPEAGLRECAGT